MKKSAWVYNRPKQHNQPTEHIENNPCNNRIFMFGEEEVSNTHVTVTKQKQTIATTTKT